VITKLHFLRKSISSSHFLQTFALENRRFGEEIYDEETIIFLAIKQIFSWLFWLVKNILNIIFVSYAFKFVFINYVEKGE